MAYFNRMKHSCFWFCILLAFSAAQAQPFSRSGLVVDRNTEEAIPFATVFCSNNPAEGTNSDFDGRFSLRMKNTCDSMVITAIGYKRLAVPLTASDTSLLILKMREDNVLLSEVIIRPQENPAIAFMRDVVQRKPFNNRDEISWWQANLYSKLEGDISDVSDKLINNPLLKPVRFVFNNFDSTSENKPYLPVFLAEAESRLFYREQPKILREEMLASRISGSSNSNFSGFLGAGYAQYNMYENWVDILNRDFVSPLADAGLDYYDYYLTDTADFDGVNCFKVSFEPKGKSSNTLKGDFWIVEDGLALKQMNVRMAPHVNIDFITRINIFQNFQFVQDSFWLLQEEKLLFDVLKRDNKPGFICRKTSVYSDYLVNDPKIAFRIPDESVLVSNANVIKEEDQYWDSIRPVQLTHSEKQVYSTIDSLAKVPAVKFLIKLGQTVSTGYWVAGPLEVGRLTNIVDYNSAQGWNYELGLRTSNSFSKKIMLTVSGGYASRTKQGIYGAEINFVPQKLPRTEVSVSSRMDAVGNSRFDDNFGGNGFLNMVAFRRFENGQHIPFKMLFLREHRLYVLKEWKNGFSMSMSLSHRSMNPYFQYSFQSSNISSDADTAVVNAEVKLNWRYTKDERFLSGEFERFSLGSENPTYILEFKQGVPSVFGSSYRYQSVELAFLHKFKIKPLGLTRVKMAAGMIQGELPYFLLKIPAGSESYSMQTNGFNLLKEYELVADRYIYLLAEHQFDGLLFNRIPLLRKLKWRETASLSLFWGSLNDRNRTANWSAMKENNLNGGPVQLEVPDSKPYVEMSAGIENVLKLLRFDLVWRMTYLQKQKNTNLGLRFGMKVQI